MRVNADEERAEDTFRALPLVPTQRDLTSDDRMFVRRNRDTGRYDNLEDYLDVQFRLFRADLILPLRDSIARYVGAHDAESAREGGRGVRVYSDVQIVRPVCTDRELSYRLSFDVTGFSRVEWRTSQRLKYGSLVCLSTDNFQTYLCAVVHERDVRLLSNGLVDVVFVLERRELHRVVDVGRDTRFVMVESPGYFEAYRHVLQGLKNLNDNNFPFVRYIVDCQPDVGPPRYLRGDENARYDFRPLLEDDFVIEDDRGGAAADTALAGDVAGPGIAEDAGGVAVMSRRDWPTPAELGLDASQHLALHTALTKEFVVVQGPPGTGKTYLGLKILKMLLHNSRAWNDPAQRRPLLVVCYTNHALDQFLEGVLDFFTGSLVRVGQRNVSDRLKERTLYHNRTRARENRLIPMETHEAKVRARLELKALRIDIHEKAARLEMAEREVVREEFLKDFMGPNAVEDFRRSLGRGGGDSAILRWLKLEKLHERLVHQAEHRAHRLPPVHALLTRTPQLSAPVPHALQDRDEKNDDDEDEDDDDDDDDETLEVSSSFRDNAHARRLDADADDEEDEEDDDFFDTEIDFDDLDKEETESQRLRRRQRDTAMEAMVLRAENVVLDVSGFCADREQEEEEVRDRTAERPTSRARDKEVADELRKLRLQQKRRLQNLLRSVNKMSLDEADQVADIWGLKVGDRWRLYRHWVDLFCRQTRGEIREKEELYFDRARKYREILEQEDRFILQQAAVVGMTTTGAARYQATLHAIGPRVIIVEEAAEVFEAHVVATLSLECQHLILIGDHKQLRPNPTVFDLAKKCHLDVSLFERMVNNGFQVDCLQYQHRMRPEISRMMKLPPLYPLLQDHDVVLGMPPVKGVRRNVFYINHSEPEDRDPETKSCSNVHEAEYLVALCDYLLKQGYRRSQVTILTPYSGQVHIISSRMKKREFEGVRVSSVDNYQGEENDIVLLSLVRSNNDNGIGFLKVDNRICVALSRAKMGMYVIGNFEVLRQNGSLLETVIKSADAQGILGDGLPLACQNHPREEGIMAVTAKDFRKAPEGGCRKRCDVRLPCGHQCTSTCHPGAGHETFVCPLPCARRCQDCDQQCQEGHACCDHTHCRHVTLKLVPGCGHRQPVACGTDPQLAECRAACRLTLGCGHPCQNACSQPCTRPCRTEVTVDSPACGHRRQVACSERDAAACSQPCGHDLVCDHRCVGTCGTCKAGRLHVPCEQRCRKILVCGHDCQAACCQCPPCALPCQNKCSHSRCDKPCGDPCVSCAMKCDWQCEHHVCSKLCGQPCDRDRCNQPCRKKLPDCRHPCIGLCGETCPPFCRVCDPEILKDSVFGEPEEDDRFVLLEDCCHVLEVTSLDRWVDASRGGDRGGDEGADNSDGGRGGDEGADNSDGGRGGDEGADNSDGGRGGDEGADNSDGDRGGDEGADNSDGGGAEGEEGEEARLVKLPECPQCKTPIRRNLRYGNVVKEALRELEVIKQRCRGDQTALDGLERRVEQAVARLPLDLRRRAEGLVGRGQVRSESRLATHLYQLTLLTDANQLLNQVSSAVTRWPDVAETYGAVRTDVQQLMTWTLRPRDVLSQQELFDIRQEFPRLRVLVHLLHCRHSIATDHIQVEARLMRRLAACIRQLMTAGPVAEKEVREGRELREELKDVVADPYSALSDEERESIVRAVSLPTGHWYACARGHYYVIGECGRPTEVASCPECRSAIGGENHALTGGNRPAPEFDNAEGPLWTEEMDFDYALRLHHLDLDNRH